MRAARRSAICSYSIAMTSASHRPYRSQPRHNTTRHDWTRHSRSSHGSFNLVYIVCPAAEKAGQGSARTRRVGSIPQFGSIVPRKFSGPHPQDRSHRVSVFLSSPRARVALIDMGMGTVLSLCQSHRIVTELDRRFVTPQRAACGVLALFCRQSLPSLPSLPFPAPPRRHSGPWTENCGIHPPKLRQWPETPDRGDGGGRDGPPRRATSSGLIGRRGEQAYIRVAEFFRRGRRWVGEEEGEGKRVGRVGPRGLERRSGDNAQEGINQWK